jgi:hypothetical protein
MEAKIVFKEGGEDKVMWEHNVASHSPNASLSSLSTALEQLRKDSNEALTDLMSKYNTNSSNTDNAAAPSQPIPTHPTSDQGTYP